MFHRQIRATDLALMIHVVKPVVNDMADLAGRPRKLPLSLLKRTRRRFIAGVEACGIQVIARRQTFADCNPRRPLGDRLPDGREQQPNLRAAHPGPIHKEFRFKIDDSVHVFPFFISLLLASNDFVSE